MSDGPTKIDHVLSELQTIKREQREMWDEQRAQGDKIYDMHGKVSGLEVKSSIFGMVGGMIVAALAYLKGH
jgi:hypothetical protein